MKPTPKCKCKYDWTQNNIQFIIVLFNIYIQRWLICFGYLPLLGMHGATCIFAYKLFTPRSAARISCTIRIQFKLAYEILTMVTPTYLQPLACPYIPLQILRPSGGIFGRATMQQLPLALMHSLLLLHGIEPTTIVSLMLEFFL